MIRKILYRLIPSVGNHNARNSLHSAEVMYGILDRERMRCDRGNSSFALLTLTFAKPWTASQLDLLAIAVRERIRATDDAGLMGPRRLAVILPETQPDGAWKVAEDLCELLPEDMHAPECDVYMYPDRPSHGESNGAANSRAVNGETNGHTNGRAQLAETNGSANGHSSNGRTKVATNGKAGDRPRERVALPMQTLFVRPLPLWKRVIDVVVASAALVVLSPLLFGVAMAIKLTSPGPIIFKQKRDTIGGRPFTIYKFRTMSVDAEAKKAELLALSEQDGPAFKIAKDPRITRLGSFLRVTSIDELPQLYNVVKGDMTLVGPRAMDSKESSRCESWQRRRLDVTAGITCIWQVHGRSAVSFAEWMRMDLTYVESRSLKNDLKLIAQTVPAVLLRRGAC